MHRLVWCGAEPRISVVQRPSGAFRNFTLLEKTYIFEQLKILSYKLYSIDHNDLYRLVLNQLASCINCIILGQNFCFLFALSYSTFIFQLQFSLLLSRHWKFLKAWLLDSKLIQGEMVARVVLSFSIGSISFHQSLSDAISVQPIKSKMVSSMGRRKKSSHETNETR